MKLPPGNTEPAFGILIKISVEHPYRSIRAWNVLLEHQSLTGGVFHGVVFSNQLVLGSGNYHFLSGSPGHVDVVAGLQHDGKLSLLAKIDYIVPGLRKGRLGGRNG